MNTPSGMTGAPPQISSNEDKSKSQASGVGTKKLMMMTTTSSQFASAIKPNRLSVVRDTGRVTLDDIKGVTPATIRMLNDLGIWTPEDAYELYKNGRLGELKELAKKKGFGGKSNPIDTIANVIFTAKTIDPTLNINTIKQNIQNAPNVMPFDERRKREIKSYLKFIGVGSAPNQRITIETRGAGVNIDFVKQLRHLNVSIPPKSVLGKNRQIMDIDEAEKEAVIDYAFRNAITGVRQNDLKKISKVKNKEWAFSEVANKYADLLSDGTLITDPDWNIVRPNDDIMKERTFNASDILIGSTASPMIPKVAVVAPARPKGFKGLIIEASNKPSQSIRIKGDMVINGEKDLDKVAEILGISPKTGFAPVGYDYTDDTIAQSPIFNVFFRPPQSKVNLIFKPREVIPVKEDPSDPDSDTMYTIQVGKKFDPYLKSHIWIADVDRLASENIGYTNAEYVFKKEAKEKLPKKLRFAKIGDLPDEYYAKTVLNGMEYAGTICNRYKKGLPIEARNDLALYSEIQLILKSASRHFRTTTPILEAALSDLASIKRDLLYESEMMKNVGSSAKDIAPNKEIYGKSKPKCQITVSIPWQKGGRVIFINSNTPVAEKLDKVRRFCETKSKKPNVCMRKLVKITQNTTDLHFGGERNQSPADKALEKAVGIKRNWDKILDTYEIVREMATGQKAVNRNGRTMYSFEKRNILNDAKTMNKRPLDISEWTFLDGIKNKKLTSFIE